VFRATRQVLLLAELAAGVALHATDRGWWHCGDIVAGVDYPGNDLGATVVGSARECQARCTAEPRCRRFTWAAAGTGTKDTEEGWYAGADLQRLGSDSSPNGVEWSWLECAYRCGQSESCVHWHLQLAGPKQCVLVASERGQFHSDNAIAATCTGTSTGVYACDLDPSTDPTLGGACPTGCTYTAATRSGSHRTGVRAAGCVTAQATPNNQCWLKGADAPAAPVSSPGRESGPRCPPDWRLKEWTGTYTAAEALPAGTTLRASDFDPPLLQQNVSCQDIGAGHPMK
jgi:hypothetical protein